MADLVGVFDVSHLSSLALKLVNTLLGVNNLLLDLVYFSMILENNFFLDDGLYWLLNDFFDRNWSFNFISLFNYVGGNGLVVLDIVGVFTNLNSIYVGLSV